jgi:hypothetical protein
VKELVLERIDGELEIVREELFNSHPISVVAE